MPLATASEGEMHKVRKITGTDKIRLHLQEMGFVGSMVKIVSSLGDNMIVAVGDARVAISRELAQRIMV